MNLHQGRKCLGGMHTLIQCEFLAAEPIRWVESPGHRSIFKTSVLLKKKVPKQSFKNCSAF